MLRLMIVMAICGMPVAVAQSANISAVAGVGVGFGERQDEVVSQRQAYRLRFRFPPTAARSNSITSSVDLPAGAKTAILLREATWSSFQQEAPSRFSR